jgi:hypothetical protein
MVKLKKGEKKKKRGEGEGGESLASKHFIYTSDNLIVFIGKTFVLYTIIPLIPL